ncbi:nucleoporin GLE1 [Aplysia californica]|uniref:mRNA export factor GLE1 n=1 Tax=Aplysia californica TaxID=6500 RepID=A0ABM0K2G6_APLCA|nr:nucleoporin GLE1 [Aplysia californica]
MSVLDGLRNSPKGQLPYTRRHLEPLELKHALDQVSPVPLSRHHKERESSKFNLSFGLDASSFDDTDDINDDFNDNCSQQDSSVWRSDLFRLNKESFKSTVSNGEFEKKDPSKDDPRGTTRLAVSDVVGRSPGTLDWWAQLTTPVDDSLQFGTSLRDIKDAETAWQECSELALLERLSHFESHERSLAGLIQQREQEMQKKLAQQVEDRQKLIDRKLREKVQETQKVLQKQKADHEEHQMKIVTKNREIERQRQKLEEEERARQALQKEKQQTLRSILQEVDENRRKFNEILEACPHKDQLDEVVGKFKLVLDRFGSKSDLQTNAPLDDVISKFEDQRLKSHKAVEFLKAKIAEADARSQQEAQKKKEEEEAKAKEEKRKAETKKLEEQAAEDCGVQALAYILREFAAKHKKLSEVQSGLQAFIDNAQLKKQRFDLQRAVNTPINAISALSGAHLRDKLQRLHDLLGGRPVEVSGKRVQATVVAEGPMFCQNLVAKMLVRKGEEQVTSKHESAFAIGAVAVALWAEFPLVGELFMAHLHAVCPYVLPLYAVRQGGQSSADFHRAQGYKIADDGSIEDQDKFLRRMSGLMRLYCACLVAPVPPKGPNCPHPQGLEHAWRWLARVLDLEPQPDVTAALIHDMLSVAGHALCAEYRGQFAKLLRLLHAQYLPKLKSVSVTSAIVGRLEIFLETAVKNNCRIPPPEGILPQNFWFR